MDTLKAEKRNMATKAKKLRREGFVTGNVFGREMKETMPIQILKLDAERLLKTKTKGGRVTLEMEGQKMDVLIKEIDFNALKNQIDEIDFQALVSGEKVHSVAEVILLNHENIVEGIAQQKLYEIAYQAIPAALVDKVEIDVKDMKIGDVIKVKDLDIATKKELDLQTDPDAIVVMVTEIHNAPVKEEDTEETDTATE